MTRRFPVSGNRRDKNEFPIQKSTPGVQQPSPLSLSLAFEPTQESRHLDSSGLRRLARYFTLSSLRTPHPTPAPLFNSWALNQASMCFPLLNQLTHYQRPRTPYVRISVLKSGRIGPLVGQENEAASWLVPGSPRARLFSLLKSPPHACAPLTAPEQVLNPALPFWLRPLLRSPAFSLVSYRQGCWPGWPGADPSSDEIDNPPGDLKDGAQTQCCPLAPRPKVSPLLRLSRPGLDSRLTAGGATPPGAERRGKRPPGLSTYIAPARGKAQAPHAASLQLSSPRWYFPLYHPLLPARLRVVRLGGWAEVERPEPCSGRGLRRQPCYLPDGT